jgi:hypothetical protein
MWRDEGRTAPIYASLNENRQNVPHSIMPIETRTRGYGTYSKCSQYGL